jgi:hypothetical protein
MGLHEEVMEKGKETLLTDTKELKITEERLADAQEKLRQISQSESLVGPEKKTRPPECYSRQILRSHCLPAHPRIHEKSGVNVLRSGISLARTLSV